MSFIEIGLLPIETGAALGRQPEVSKKEKVKSKKAKIFIDVILHEFLCKDVKLQSETKENYRF